MFSLQYSLLIIIIVFINNLRQKCEK